MKLIKAREALLGILAVALVAVLVIQRSLIFSKGRFGLFTSDSFPLFLWALLCLIAVLVTRPWRVVSRFGTPVRYAALLLSLASGLFVLACTSDWGRYQLIRLEALHHNFQITNLGEIRLSRPFIEETGVGELMARDPLLREYAFAHSGADLLRYPQVAAVFAALELQSGKTLEALFEQPGGHEILLGCLVNEANPRRWSSLPWFTPPPGAVLSAEQSKLLVDRLAEKPKEHSRQLLENLLFVATQFPQYFEEPQRQVMLEAWAAGFDDLQPLAVEGLLVREQLKEMIPADEDEVEVAVEITGADPTDYYYRDLDQVMKLTILGLVRSCGHRPVEVDPGRAQLKITVELGEIAHHTYSVPTYDYQTYYEYRQTGRFEHFRFERIARQRKVTTGQVEKTAFAPIARVTLAGRESTVELPEMLIFWHHLRFDHERGGFMDLQSEETFGRMWPFGLHKYLFEWDS